MSAKFVAGVLLSRTRPDLAKTLGQFAEFYRLGPRAED